METAIKNTKRALLILLKDFSRTHTITSLAKELSLSRVGVWKLVQKLKEEKLVIFHPVGSGKTSTVLITLNWDNILVEKRLLVYLTEEALVQKRWMHTFTELERTADFLILYGSILPSPKEAHDVDIMAVVSGTNRFVSMDTAITKIQKTEMKKIHTVLFGRKELINELKKSNKAFIDALKKGTVLFGQEDYLLFMKKVHTLWHR